MDQPVVPNQLENVRRPSLSHRLRQKLRELSEEHQRRVKEHAQMSQEIQKLTEEIKLLPQKHDQVQHKIARLTQKVEILRAENEMLDRKIAELESTAAQTRKVHHDIRQQILTDVCQDDENDIVEDTLDVKTAEIRRQIGIAKTCQRELGETRAEIYGQLTDLNRLLAPETLAKDRERLQAQLDEKLQLQKTLAENRDASRLTMHECQRLLDDLEERQTLETYAKNNGLVLDNNSTDELIRVCRTHQEKIAAKNAAVDAENPAVAHNNIPSHHHHHHHEDANSDSSDDDRSITETPCDCSHCLGLESSDRPSVDSVHYFRVQEAVRRQDGLTVAGSVNTKQRRQTRQEHGENGWCQHW